MASINFRTRGNGTENASVYITFRNGRKLSLEINSGITIPNSDWLAKGKTRNIAAFTNKIEVQNKLDGLKALVSSELNNTTNYTKEWFQGIVNSFHGIVDEPERKEISLSEMFGKYIQYIEQKANETRANSTVKSYQVNRGRIDRFDEHKKNIQLLSETGVRYKGDFINWARQIEKYSPGTYLKTAKQIKTVVRYAKRIGLVIDESILTDTESTEMSRYRVTRKKPIYLSIDEINLLMKFEGADYLENARDWLVVSCWTGCRVSDLMRLTSDNIYTTITGEKAIQYRQQKTGDRINAPFHPNVKQITTRYNGGFPRPISHQRYNDFIKELCKRIGMNEKIEGTRRSTETNRNITGQFPKYELITSHIGRRSFATNHYGKLPTETIMLVTGHDTVRQFLDYVGADPEEHVTQLNAFYRTQSQPTTESLKTLQVS